MWFIIISLLVIAVICILVYRYDEDPELTGIVFVVLVLIFGLLSYPLIASTTGLVSNYSEGERIGYLTKISTKGLIWKTNEAQLQIGTGEISALQEPWDFSIPNSSLVDKAKNLQGSKVRIKYVEWLIQPYRRGESRYEAISIEIEK